MLRVEVQGQFGSASTRFADGTRENLGADFEVDAKARMTTKRKRELGRIVGKAIGMLRECDDARAHDARPLV